MIALLSRKKDRFFPRGSLLSSLPYTKKNDFAERSKILLDTENNFVGPS